ncbi:AI-2E family transporter [Aeromicrobium sp. Leaf350]|uniref:AI-2E family transporter n=1 Tax=Aeromicrobium sp. Leaf350 TaxID=2876565 RepID=UPI001E5C52C6|nr:AI-2E family transporter [Aeromicrobium sp. Leaf350]
MSQRYQVPIGVEIATAWAWRLIVIAAAGLGLLYLLQYFSEITVPITIGLLGTALTIGFVDWLERRGIPRLLATIVVAILMLVGLVGLVALVGQQLSTQFDELRSSVVAGIGELRDWARNGPLGLSDSDLNRYVTEVQDAISGTGREAVLDQATAVGISLAHFVTGFFIALFASVFFLWEGDRIWAWVVTLFPREARAKVNSSGNRAWESLTSFVRATVLVAFVDALGIALGAWLLGVPLTFAVGVIVFLGAFVPIIGAFASGMIAVLVALVAQGPWTALFMLLVVIGVQQLESHVLQPFLMGRLVAVHPLAIIAAIAAGITVSGVVGALVAVPLVACLNGVVRHLAEQAGNPLQEDGLPEDVPPDAELPAEQA